MGESLCVVVLNHKNNKDTIEPCLYSILGQEGVRNLELVLVNNGCLPPLIDHEMVLVNVDETSRAIARNFGVLNAHADQIVFLDGDTVLISKDALSYIQSLNSINWGFGAKRFWTYPPGLFEEKRKVYLQKILKMDSEWLLDDARCFFPRGLDPISGYKDLQGYTFPGNFGFVSRELFIEIGGFYEAFQGYGGEDDYFAYCCYKSAPKTFVSLKDLHVLHINHRKVKSNDAEGQNQNGSLLKRLINMNGHSSFNVNVLLGLPDYSGQEVLEQYD